VLGSSIAMSDPPDDHGEADQPDLRPTAGTFVPRASVAAFVPTAGGDGASAASASSAFTVTMAPGMLQQYPPQQYPPQQYQPQQYPPQQYAQQYQQQYTAQYPPPPQGAGYGVGSVGGFAHGGNLYASPQVFAQQVMSSGGTPPIRNPIMGPPPGNLGQPTLVSPLGETMEFLQVSASVRADPSRPWYAHACASLWGRRRSIGRAGRWESL
jgi:hypothetical protein